MKTERTPQPPYNRDKIHDFVKEHASSPGKTQVIKGIGVAELTAACCTNSGLHIILSNPGELNEQKAYSPENEEVLEKYLEAIYTDKRILTIQVQARAAEDLHTFRELLAHNLGLIGGFSSVGHEFIPWGEDGFSAPSKVTLDEAEGEVDGFVARLRVPVNLTET
jgi:hypothetical protein